MLKELGNEIIELFKAVEVKDAQIAELKRENEGLKTNIESLNARISELQAELNLKIEEITNKDNVLTEKENKIVELQEQIVSLEEEKNVTLQTIQEKENVINSLNAQTVALQGEKERLQADLNVANNLSNNFFSSAASSMLLPSLQYIFSGTSIISSLIFLPFSVTSTITTLSSSLSLYLSINSIESSFFNTGVRVPESKCSFCPISFTVIFSYSHTTNIAIY